MLFEARPEIGGQWAYQPEPNGAQSPMYDGVILNSCRDTSSFSDFPLDPARYANFFGHRLMLQYLHEYCDHFGLKKYMRLKTPVHECKPVNDTNGADGWLLKVQEEGQEVEEMCFGSVFACTGHNSTPIIPDFKGRNTFRGQFLHSQAYRTPGAFEGKRVAIIGIGSSGVDISSEIAAHAKELHVVTRRGAWIIPRYVLGKPTEAWDNRATQVWVPHSIGQYMQEKLLNLVQGKPPKELLPEHRLLEQSPTVRTEFMEQVKNHIITIQRAEVDYFNETGIVLSTGNCLEVDVVICATGYRQNYVPYLPSDAMGSSDTPEHTPGLFRFMINPQYENLYMLGFLEVFGPHHSAAEAQARYAAGIISGRVKKPSREAMMKDLRALQVRQGKSFIRSHRHTQLVYGISYIDHMLEPLHAVPSFPRLLRQVFTSGNPWQAVKVLNAVWFSLPSSAQWRLCGQGAKYTLARDMVLRIAAGKDQLTDLEIEAVRDFRA